MAVDPLQKESPDISPLWGKVGNVKATMRSGFGVTLALRGLRDLAIRAAQSPKRPSMKALLCTHYGTPDDLELADIADPEAGPDEAVVNIRAAALNFFDTLIIAGKYQFKPAPPFSPARRILRRNREHRR